MPEVMYAGFGIVLVILTTLWVAKYVAVTMLSVLPWINTYSTFTFTGLDIKVAVTATLSVAVNLPSLISDSYCV